MSCSRESINRPSQRDRQLMLRLRTLVIAAAAVMIGTAEVKAIPPIILGIEIRPDDFLGGRVSAANRKFGSINMGIVHGVRLQQTLTLFRKEEGVFQRVGTVQVVRVRQQSAIVQGVTARVLIDGDLCVVQAAELDLWGDNTNLDRAKAKARIVENGGRNFYDTFDTQVNSRELMSLLAAKKQSRIPTIGRERSRLRPDLAVFYDMTRLRLIVEERKGRVEGQVQPQFNSNLLFDPASARFVGFPIREIGPEVNIGDNLAANTEGISFSQTEKEKIVVPADLKKLDQYSEMRKFMGRQLFAWEKTQTPTDSATSSPVDSADNGNSSDESGNN